MSRVVVSRRGEEGPMAPILASIPAPVEISPWIDATQDETGKWQLPDYPCEIQGLAPDDPKNVRWRPGDYTLGVDNVDYKEDGPQEYGGQRLWDGDLPPREWNPKRLPENVQELLKVPHMPGQPLKEMFARMKALEPGLFEDRYYKDIFRDLPKDWRYLLQRIQWAEKRGIYSEESPGSFAGQEELLVPAVYHTQRLDTATICVGRSSSSDSSSSQPLSDRYDYDFLEMLYVKDQEGKVVQVVPWESCGIYPAVFWTYSFKPPRGTNSLTPFAAFKLRGVWQGEAVEWDPTHGSEEMDWFTNMAPELRRELADPKLLEGPHKMEVESLPRPKREKELPVLWPENSWQGNVAKAKIWDQLQQ